GALAEALDVALGGIPLDAHDLLLGIVDRPGGLPAQAGRRGIEQLAPAAVGVDELVGAAGIDLVADVLDHHRFLPSCGWAVALMVPAVSALRGTILGGCRLCLSLAPVRRGSPSPPKPAIF